MSWFVPKGKKEKKRKERKKEREKKERERKEKRRKKGDREIEKNTRTHQRTKQYETPT